MNPLSKAIICSIVLFFWVFFLFIRLNLSSALNKVTCCRQPGLRLSDYEVFMTGPELTPSVMVFRCLPNTFAAASRSASLCTLSACPLTSPWRNIFDYTSVTCKWEIALVLRGCLDCGALESRPGFGKSVSPKKRKVSVQTALLLIFVWKWGWEG